MGTWSVAMSAVCGCTLLYVDMHHDQGLIVDYKPSLYIMTLDIKKFSLKMCSYLSFAKANPISV